MKSVNFLVFFLFTVSVYCQPKYTSYKSSFFKNKEYNIKLSYENEKIYTMYIDLQSMENSIEGGMVITSEVHQYFLDSLAKVKSKFVEWVEVAKKNNVTEVSKQMEVDFRAPASYFYMNEKKFYHLGSNLVFLFTVVEGKPNLTIWTQNLISSENKYFTNKGFLLVFTSEKEISDFLNIISIQKVKDFIKKPKTSDLFKK